MKRGEIYWAELGPPSGRRPVLIVTRESAISFLSSVVVVPISRTVREIRSEVAVGSEEGLSEESAANCDNLLTVPKQRLDAGPVGALGPVKIPELDAALRFALGIFY